MTTGDPAAASITQFLQRLGWKGKGTPWDFLPMLLSGADNKPRFFDIPDELCIRVHIEHPSIEAITDMDLQWFAVPGFNSSLL